LTVGVTEALPAQVESGDSPELTQPTAPVGPAFVILSREIMDQRRRQRLFDRADWAVFHQELRAAHWQHSICHETRNRVARILAASEANRQVDAFCPKIQQLRFGDHLHLDFGA
jgi:hypothetical protein